jgi:hypothetical protein
VLRFSALSLILSRFAAPNALPPFKVVGALGARYKSGMSAPDKTFQLTIPGNLCAALRREAIRVDRRADSLLLEHVMRWLQTLPDPDALNWRSTQRISRIRSIIGPTYSRPR